MTAPQLPDQLVQAYQQHTQQMRAKIAAFVTATWAALGVYGAVQMAQFVKQVTPVILAGQTQMSALTVGYLSAQRNATIGRSLATRVNPAAVTGAAARKGVSPADVYGRPFHLVWRELAKAQAERDAHYTWKAPTVELLERPALPPADYVDQAIQSGLNNAISSAMTDLQLSKVQTAQHVLTQDPKVVGFRRVLEGPHSCGLCIVASTQRYHKADLMPIHPACDCSEEPIYGTEDPGRIIDQETLSAVHQAIADRFGQSSAAARNIPGQFVDGRPVGYKDVLITHDHGELGPILAIRGQQFTSAHDYDIRDVPRHDLTSVS